MKKETAIRLFESRQVRSLWNPEEEKWYFSIVDVVGALTDSVNPRDYWFKIKSRATKEEGMELSTNCRQLKMEASDGKMGIYGI